MRGAPAQVIGQNRPPNPPKEILACYFAQRTGGKPQNEGKLILVGRGGVGKTPLVKTLMTGTFKEGKEPPRESRSTFRREKALQNHRGSRNANFAPPLPLPHFLQHPPRLRDLPL